MSLRLGWALANTRRARADVADVSFDFELTKLLWMFILKHIATIYCGCVFQR